MEEGNQRQAGEPGDDGGVGLDPQAVDRPAAGPAENPLVDISRSCCICCCISRKVLSVVSMLLHLFELFLDSDKTDGDIPRGDSHDLADFLITEVLQPEQDDGAVKGAQLADALPQKANLAGVSGGCPRPARRTGRCPSTRVRSSGRASSSGPGRYKC